jgi:hypothetical protein
MLNMVLHTLLIYLTVHSEGSTVCAQAGKYAYHFRHIIEMFWAPMHGHKCLRSELFKMDENLVFCDIPAEKLTLG